MVSKEMRFVLHMVFASLMIFGAFTVPAVLLCIRYQDYNELAHNWYYIYINIHYRFYRSESVLL